MEHVNQQSFLWNSYGKPGPGSESERVQTTHSSPLIHPYDAASKSDIIIFSVIAIISRPSLKSRSGLSDSSFGGHGVKVIKCSQPHPPPGRGGATRATLTGDDQILLIVARGAVKFFSSLKSFL